MLNRLWEKWEMSGPLRGGFFLTHTVYTKFCACTVCVLNYSSQTIRKVEPITAGRWWSPTDIAEGALCCPAVHPICLFVRPFVIYEVVCDRSNAVICNDLDWPLTWVSRSQYFWRTILKNAAMQRRRYRAMLIGNHRQAWTGFQGSSIFHSEIIIFNKKAVLSQRWPRDVRHINGSSEPLWRYGHSKLSKMAACHQLGFDVARNSAIRSADPENPTLEPNMKCIGSPVAEIRPFAYLGGIWNPYFGGRGGRRGSAMTPLERAMVVSYRLSIVTVVLSVPIRPQFAIECLRRPNQRGVTLGQNFWCSPWSRPLMFGSAESEHPRLTNGEIISEKFQPMWSQYTNVPDVQLDGQTTCDRNTALCTKVHHAVKTARLRSYCWTLIGSHIRSIERYHL